MKYLVLTSLLFLSFCKEPANYWNPQANFPLLKADGTASESATEIFNLGRAPENADILLINFFAPDCKPCIIEVPDLKKIYAGIKDNPKIAFVAIGSTLDSLSDTEVSSYTAVTPEVHKFVKSFALPYPTYIGLTRDLKNFGLTGFPETFILNRNEKRQWYVKRRFVGMITEKDVGPFLHK